MRSLRSQKQIPNFAIAIVVIFTAYCPGAYAGQCVTDYLISVLPKLEEKYVETKRSLRIGFVPVNRYPSPKNIKQLTPELKSSEAGEITWRDLPKNHWLSEWAEEIHNQGAELRFVEYEQKPPWYSKWERTHRHGGAYFSYDQKTKVPYIAVSVSATPETLAHEFDHLEKWIKLRNSLLDQGLGFQAASEVASKFFLGNVTSRHYAERSAVSQELKQESEIQRSVNANNPVKWRYPSGALPFTELEVLTRHLIYPEAEAVKMALVQKSPEAAPLMQALIRKALLLRLTSYQRAQEALATLPLSKKEDFWLRVSQLSSNPGARKAYLSRAAQIGGPELETGLELDVNNHILFMQGLENLDQFFDSLMLAEKGRFQVSNVYEEARKLFEAELPSVWKSLPAQKRGDFKPRFKQ